MSRRPPLDEVGEEPDPRFTFANERTFLAWHRTAMAMIAGGLAVTELLPDFDLPGGGRWMGLPLVIVGGVIALTSYRRWEDNQRALRTGAPLPHSWLLRLVSVALALAAVVAVVLLIVGSE